MVDWRVVQLVDLLVENLAVMMVDESVASMVWPLVVAKDVWLGVPLVAKMAAD